MIGGLFNAIEQQANVCNVSFDESTDVVYETPPKGRDRKTKHKTAKVVENKLSAERIPLASENEQSKCEKVVERVYRHPYAFFEVNDILGLCNKHFTVNDHIKTVGSYKLKRSDVHRLNPHNCINKETELNLNFRLLDNLPDSGQIIEVYGSIEFKSSVSALLVHFWKYRCGDISRYIKVLCQQRLLKKLTAQPSYCE